MLVLVPLWWNICYLIFVRPIFRGWGWGCLSFFLGSVRDFHLFTTVQTQPHCQGGITLKQWNGVSGAAVCCQGWTTTLLRKLPDYLFVEIKLFFNQNVHEICYNVLFIFGDKTQEKFLLKFRWKQWQFETKWLKYHRMWKDLLNDFDYLKLPYCTPLLQRKIRFRKRKKYIEKFFK